MSEKIKQNKFGIDEVTIRYSEKKKNQLAGNRMMCIMEIICLSKAVDNLVHVRNIRVIEQKNTPSSEYYKIQARNIYYFAQTST